MDPNLDWSGGWSKIIAGLFTSGIVYALRRNLVAIVRGTYSYILIQSDKQKALHSLLLQHERDKQTIASQDRTIMRQQETISRQDSELEEITQEIEKQATRAQRRLDASPPNGGDGSLAIPPSVDPPPSRNGSTTLHSRLGSPGSRPDSK